MLLRTDTDALFSGSISRTRRPPPPDLTVSLETVKHFLPLRLVLLEISEDLFLFWVVLAYPLQASLRFLYGRSCSLTYFEQGKVTKRWLPITSITSVTLETGVFRASSRFLWVE